MTPEQRVEIEAEVAKWPPPSEELLKRLALMTATEINELARED